MVELVSRQGGGGARLVVPLFQEARKPPAGLGGWLTGSARRALEERVFKGECGEALLLIPPRARGSRTAVLLGLGPEKKVTLETLRRAFGLLARRTRKEGVAEVIVDLRASPLGEKLAELGWEAASEAIAVAWRTGSYTFDAYKTAGGKGRKPPLLKLSMDASGSRRSALAAGLRRAEALGDAADVVRDLANTPANDLYPERLADHARRLARSAGLSFRLLRKADLIRERMGGLLGVAQGSDRPPCLMTLEYRPRARAARVPTVALVGKAITFDSGGLSIKPAKGMEEMKFDMAGGAAVLGAMTAIAALKPPVRVVGIVPSTENVIGGSAMRPGDILRSASGKTIEVINTDAEGRLILADALHYALRFRPDYVIDFATLTGACLVALGTQVSGMVTNDRDLGRAVFDAGERSGERVWELPLYEEFIEATKSQVADLKNSAGRNGGAITAAAFLSHFVGKARWCHLDIAGTAWVERDTGAHAAGATGVGVRLIVELIRGLSRPKA